MFLSLLLAAPLVAQQAPVISIIHTNDTHSQIEPAVAADGTQSGGVVERASLIELFRQSDPELLYLDAGDMIQGSPYFNIYRGELEMLCMNSQQLTATTFGNHEFDNGIDGVQFMQQTAQFPIVSCNYHCDSTVIAPLIVPHLITYSHDVKIGITGVTTDPEGLITGRNWQGISYEDPIQAVNREASYLRSEGCDVVIVLSHLGYLPVIDTAHEHSTLDTQLAAATHDVDLIIGGHTHVNIEHGMVQSNADGHPVMITQTGGKANPIGHICIAMKAGSTYPGCRFSVDSIVCQKLHPADYDLTGLGQDVRDIVEPYREVLARQMDVPIGQAPVFMTKGRPQSLLGNFTADALMSEGQRLTGRHIDVALMNIGGLRNDIQVGDVTVGTMFRIYPFENHVVVLDLLGSDLIELIRSDAGTKLNAWSGTQITLQMQGDRCIASSILVGGQPIDPERIYTISTIDYLAEGNNGMSRLRKALATQTTGVLIRDAVMHYIQTLTEAGMPVTSAIDDRVIEDY